MKKVLLFLLLTVFLFSFASAEETEISFQQSTDVDIKVVCINAGYCSGSSTCNASILSPTNVAIVDNGLFTNQNSFHNFTLNETQTSILGLYKVQGFCKDGSFTKEIDFNFWITPNGLILTKAEANIYVIMTVFVFLLFLLTLWAAVGLPFTNSRDGEGRLVSIEIKKYPKLGMAFISYLMFVWFINLLMTLSLNLISLTQYSGFFVMVFNFLMAGAWVAFVAMIWAFFVLGARDLELNNVLTMGLNA